MVGWVASIGLSLIVLVVVPVHLLSVPDLPLTALEYTATVLAGIWSVGVVLAFGIFKGQ